MPNITFQLPINRHPKTLLDLQFLGSMYPAQGLGGDCGTKYDNHGGDIDISAKLYNN